MRHERKKKMKEKIKNEVTWRRIATHHDVSISDQK